MGDEPVHPLREVIECVDPDLVEFAQRFVERYRADLAELSAL